MASVYSFEDLQIWQESKMLTLRIYELFQSCRDYDFKSQIQRASVSIMNNIAEGFDRNKIDDSNKSFIYFLDISYGSCGEVRSMSYLAESIGFISSEEAFEIRRMCFSISSKTFSFIQTLKHNEKQPSVKPRNNP